MEIRAGRRDVSPYATKVYRNYKCNNKKNSKNLFFSVDMTMKSRYIIYIRDQEIKKGKIDGIQ